MQVIQLKQFALIAALLLLHACTATPDGEKSGSTDSTESAASAEPAAATTAGSGSGGLGKGALGGLLGNLPDTNASATPTAISGRLLGGPYFVHLEASDKKRARQAAATAFDRLPSGQTKIWRNPENGHWGTLTPTRTYVNADGRYCRDYDQTVTLGGQEYQANGTVCHDTGTGNGGVGGWRVVS